jgi:hypothetical protein
MTHQGPQKGGQKRVPTFCGDAALNQKVLTTFLTFLWRRERDSNPRYGYPYSGFQNRRIKPAHSTTLPSLRNKRRSVGNPTKLTFLGFPSYRFLIQSRSPSRVKPGAPSRYL